MKNWVVVVPCGGGIFIRLEEDCTVVCLSLQVHLVCEVLCVCVFVLVFPEIEVSNRLISFDAQTS